MAADIFRILSRSTKLSKSKQPQTPIIPSSSEPRPQLFGDAARDDQRNGHHELRELSGSAGSSKKRKRGQHSQTGLPPALDFFGDRSRNSHPAGPHEAGQEASGLEKVPAVKRVEDPVEQPTEAIASMEEAECKAILNSHKVKIHTLESGTVDELGDNVKEKKRKKKRKDDEQRANRKGKRGSKTALFPQPLLSFQELRSRYHISQRLAENIAEQGYTVPTEVQMASIPLLLDRGEDTEILPRGMTRSPHLLSVAPTGSGKTLAFLIPIMDAIMRSRSQSAASDSQARFSGPLAIVIAPTKELAGQITNEGRKLAARTGLRIAMMDKTMRLFDEGQNSDLESEMSSDEDSDAVDNEQKRPAKRRATARVKSHILVSTPMTLVHAITGKNGFTRTLPSVRHLVLDEADVLLDPLFREQTLSVWSACTSKDLSATLWSATMGSNIETLVSSTLASRQPHVSVRRPLVRIIVGLKDTALPTISHRLIYAANESGKLMAIRQLLHPTAPSSTTDGLVSSDTPLRPPFLVFTQTIPRAVALTAELRYDIPAVAGGSSRIAALHADLSDKQRDETMARFRKGEVWVLITTDLLARGVDFRGVNGVVNYDIPTSSAAYIHRVGRTGRAGREGGVAVTLYAEEDVPFIRGVANVIAASEAGGAEGIKKLQVLLDTLPNPSRRERQRLKLRGVEARRPGNEDARVRITTKSGYERKIERRRKDAVEATRKRSTHKATAVASGEESSFEGFGD
jgi:ATP-dependent RNA helicase DDX52/ROK1